MSIAMTRFKRRAKQFVKDIIFEQKEQAMIVYHVILILILASTIGKQLQRIHMYQKATVLLTSSVDYDRFRTVHISKEAIGKSVKKEKVLDYLTYQMMTNQYSLLEDELLNDTFVARKIKRVKQSEAFDELKGYYKMMLSDLCYFPVPLQQGGKATIEYEDTWNAKREFGGDRKHEGTDLMASKNVRGYYPILSVTDGVVERMGWLSLGGYRIGIRAPHGAYFYYAHLYSYAPKLKEGDRVSAGQLLGFMGDSGYGKEGTVGQFDVHLHFGIYIHSKEGEMSVNPYYILKYLEDYKIVAFYGEERRSRKIDGKQVF